MCNVRFTIGGWAIIVISLICTMPHLETTPRFAIGDLAQHSGTQEHDDLVCTVPIVSEGATSSG
jgi:hypothetical protein